MNYDLIDDWNIDCDWTPEIVEQIPDEEWMNCWDDAQVTKIPQLYPTHYQEKKKEKQK